MNKLSEALSAIISNNRSMLILVVGTAILGLLTLGLGSQAIASYQEATNISNQNASMKKTLSDWREAVSFINNQKYRPVEKTKVDAVTSEILFKLQAMNLQLIDFKDTSNTKKDDHYRTFTITFKGQYPETVQFFSDLHANDALVVLRQLKLTPDDDNLLKTEIVYRVYVK